MMGKNDRFSRAYYRNNEFVTAGESEGSGSSGRFDTEITASEDSSAPTRKCINLNSDKQDAFGVPMQILSLSKISSGERKDLIRRLRMELQQIRVVQKKVKVQRTNGVTMSSSSDFLSCSNGQNGHQVENFRKSLELSCGPMKKVRTCGPVKKVNALSNKGRGCNRHVSGKLESTKIQPAMPSTANIILMKQCETLLKRLMSHQYGWVFNTPVDVVKSNIPDYFTVIKHPMDLGTIKEKIASGAYSSPLEFLADVRLTFSNAMTYNPPGNDFHIMADTLRKFFEARWKAIEKKLPVTEPQSLQQKKDTHADFPADNAVPPAKKRKVETLLHEIVPEPVNPVMTKEEKQNLGMELESLQGDMPLHIIDFLREHSSNGIETGEDEIEIDIDDLHDDTLFTLRKLLDDYFKEQQKNQGRAEPCEIELLNESGPSNSSMPQGKDSDSSASSESESGGVKASSPINVSKEPEASGSGAQLEQKTSTGNPFDGNQSVSGLDQLERTSQQKPSSVESDCCQDGESAPSERQVSPEKRYRAALLKKRFADTILKAREKALSQGDKGDPEKLRREREELELRRQKEKARLQAEAKAAEEARKQAEAEAAAEARQKIEVEREAARQALLKMEKTVEINENSRFLEDLEMLRTAPAEHLPSSVDETSPDHSQDGLGSFKFGGSNPLEQLGLYMKEEDEEEDLEPPTVPNPPNDVEEGEID